MSNKQIKICFLADKHDLFDDRIYWKMAVPLKKMGYQIHYLLISDEDKIGITKEGIHFEKLKVKTFSKNKYFNFILKNLDINDNYKKLFKKAKILNADIYHFHDLWINKIGVKLKKLKHNPVVFYDAREPYAEDYVSYTKATGWLKKGVELFAKFVDKWEKYKAKHYDLVISNEEIVRNNFRSAIGEGKAEVLYNFTDNYHLFENRAIHQKKYDFIYSGGITELRGAFKILEATGIAKQQNQQIKVVFVGKYSPENLKNEMQLYIDTHDLNDNIELHSHVNYSEISWYYNNSKIGLVTLFNCPTFKISMPIKVFEYMAFGLSLIGSDFGPIRKYIETENCGLVVDPQSPEEIANAMCKLLTDLDLYQLYSENGRSATLKKYKWDFELNKLVSYYQKALINKESII